MEYFGTVRNGRIELDERTAFADGSRVRVKLISEGGNRKGTPSAILRLVGTLTDAEADAIVGPVLRGETRFTKFFEQHVSKIEKKFRDAKDSQARKDVVCELAVARGVCRIPKVRDPEYEFWGQKGPDFRFGFQQEFPAGKGDGGQEPFRFALEVTRVREVSIQCILNKCLSEVEGVLRSFNAACAYGVDWGPEFPKDFKEPIPYYADPNEPIRELDKTLPQILDELRKQVPPAIRDLDRPPGQEIVLDIAQGKVKWLKVSLIKLPEKSPHTPLASFGSSPTIATDPRYVKKDANEKEKSPKLLEIIVDKLSQLRPGLANVLVILDDSDVRDVKELERALHDVALVINEDRSVREPWTLIDEFRDPARLARRSLSAVFAVSLRWLPDSGKRPVTRWLNPNASFPIPDLLADALQRSLE